LFGLLFILLGLYVKSKKAVSDTFIEKTVQTDEKLKMKHCITHYHFYFCGHSICATFLFGKDFDFAKFSTEKAEIFDGAWLTRRTNLGEEKGIQFCQIIKEQFHTVLVVIYFKTPSFTGN
jgi:hypothetical protein